MRSSSVLDSAGRSLGATVPRQLPMRCDRALPVTHSHDRFVATADVLAAHLDGEAVLLDMGSRSYFQLNESAAVLWRRLEAGASRRELLDALCDDFAVEPGEARRELDRLLDELLSRGLIRDEGDGGGRVASGSKGGADQKLRDDR